MKIFLSHSGERARSLAEFLREWLPTINPGFNNVWVDRDSIPPGVQWSPALDRGLSESDAGIICITPESAGKPWPVAEFVCLRKDGKLAVPYLAGNAEPSHLPGPMQAHAFAIAESKQETWNMLKQLAGGAAETQLIDQMQKDFDLRWPELEKFLQELPPNPIVRFEVRCRGKWRAALKMFVEALDVVEEQSGTQIFRVEAIGKPLARLAVILFALMLTGAGAYALLLRIANEARKKPPPMEKISKNQETTAQLSTQADRIRTLEQNNQNLASSQTVFQNSDAELASMVQRLQHQLEAAENKRSNFSGTPGGVQVAAHEDTNTLLFLRHEESELMALGPLARPTYNSWLMFVPKSILNTVQLYASPEQNEPAGTLEFGVPYKVLTLNGVNLQIEPSNSDPRAIKPWIHDWASNSNYVSLWIVTNDSHLSSWRFLKIIEPRELLPPSNLQLPFPAPSNLHIAK